MPQTLRGGIRKVWGVIPKAARKNGSGGDAATLYLTSYDLARTRRSSNGVRRWLTIRNMIKVSVMYPAGEDKTFNMDYYLKVHCPLVREVFGASLQSLEVHKGLSGPFPGSEAPFQTIAYLGFASLEDFMAGMMQNAPRLMEDIPNFTNASPTIQVNEVIL